MPRSLILILGDQLFAGLPGMPSDAPIFMREDEGLATGVRHHRRKVVLFFSAMRHFARELRAAGRDVRYREWGHGANVGFGSALQACAQELGVDEIITYEPADPGVLESLTGPIPVRAIRNPMFLTSPEDWHQFRSLGKRRQIMADFYRWQRRRLDVLVEGDQPVGGAWSFDSENRKALPKGHVPPTIRGGVPDAITQEVMDLVDREFTGHPGRAEGFNFPVDHAASQEWLEDFLEWRFDAFGDYEDALSVRSATVYHSLISPLLNCGLLTPAQVVDAALARHARSPVPMNSLEGFIRQVIGWREFVKGVATDYREKDVNMVSPFGNDRRLNQAWWTGETGLYPLDLSIRRALETGWCHHIDRLMVLGSAMLMLDVHPDEAMRWFMEMFIDSADWVMGPNVYGMVMHADGPLFATKPYFSGSAYLRKMSDYPPGEWCEVWDALYWRFVYRHRDWLRANPRIGPITGHLDRMSPATLEKHLRMGQATVDRLTVR